MFREVTGMSAKGDVAVGVGFVVRIPPMVLPAVPTGLLLDILRGGRPKGTGRQRSTIVGWVCHLCEQGRGGVRLVTDSRQ